MNRRRFLSFLGLGAIAGPSAIAGPAVTPSFIEFQPPSATWLSQTLRILNSTAKGGCGFEGLMEINLSLNRGS